MESQSSNLNMLLKRKFSYSRIAQYVFIIFSLTCFSCSYSKNKWSDSDILSKLATNDFFCKNGDNSEFSIASETISRPKSANSREISRSIYINLNSITKAQFLSTYIVKIKQELADRNGVVEGINQTFDGKNANSLSGFGLDYSWNANDGIIRVFSTELTNQTVRIIVLAYEHRK